MSRTQAPSRPSDRPELIRASPDAAISEPVGRIDLGAVDDDDDRPFPARTERTTGVVRVPRAEPRSSLSPESAAVRVIEALVASGVDTFFGIPGGPSAPLFEALRLVPGTRLIESRHESSAAFAAATYQRATGRVPALLLTAGPGLTNALTGVVSAHLERVPIVVISGDVAWASKGARLAQDSGPEGVAAEQIFAACTRVAMRVARSASAATQALAVLQAAVDPLAPGPALLVVPIDRAFGAAPPVITRANAPHGTLPAGDIEVRQAARMLAHAKRPLLVLGGATRAHASVIRQLVDVLNVPFVTTPRAKGVVSEVHPRSLRNGGMAASLWARRYTAEPIDVALALGTDLDDSSMGPTPYLGAGGELIHVDIDPSVFRRNLPTALPVIADLGDFARKLYDVVVSDGLHHPDGKNLMRAVRAASPFDVPGFTVDDGYPIAPHRAIADLEEAAGLDARFISDIGEHMLFALHYLTARTASAFHIQLNLGSMGSGIAGAIGLAVADPNRRVVCICGDGGMQMSGMELLVALRDRLPIVYAVFNDGRYNMVHHGMKQIFGSAAAWETPFVDFAAWAGSFGVPSARIEAPGEINAARLDRLTAHGGPALLDIRIDREQRIRGGGRVEALQHMSMLQSGAGE
jgi:acetolactate synthase-1/2/3 large subunit